MIDQIQGTLYIDPQAARPASLCLICGGERYGSGEYCSRCERRGGHDPR